MGDILSYYQDRVANESFLGTAQTRRSIIQHLRLIGYRLGTAAPASAVLTLTVDVPAGFDGAITIRSGTARIGQVPEWDDSPPLVDGLQPFPGAQIGIILPAKGGE